MLCLKMRILLKFRINLNLIFGKLIILKFEFESIFNIGKVENLRMTFLTG